jgi:hypothetical protein
VDFKPRTGRKSNATDPRRSQHACDLKTEIPYFDLDETVQEFAE